MSYMGAYPSGPYNQQSGGYGPGGGFGHRPNEKNAFGGWALGLGMASVFCGIGPLAAIPAIIVGFLGVLAANEGRATNKGMSIIGIVMGVLAIMLTIIVFSSGFYQDIEDIFESYWT